MYTIIKELIGETLTDVRNTDDAIYFTTEKGKKYRMYHEQDCCESVIIEDIVGDLTDLIGHPLLQAEEASAYHHDELLSSKEKTWLIMQDRYCKIKEHDESQTWTFYKFATIRGSVTIRWYGCSNGYYSERVDFCEVT